MNNNRKAPAFSNNINQTTNSTLLYNAKLKKQTHAAKSEAIARHNAGLDNGVLLAGKRGSQDADFRQQARPGLDEEEAQQAGGDVEGRNDADGKVELVGDDAEKGPQQGADQQPPDGYLLLPRRDGRRRREEGLGDFGAHGVGRRTSSVAGSRSRRRRQDWEERLELMDGRRWRGVEEAWRSTIALLWEKD